MSGLELQTSGIGSDRRATTTTLFSDSYPVWTTEVAEVDRWGSSILVGIGLEIDRGIVQLQHSATASSPSHRSSPRPGPAASGCTSGAWRIVISSDRFVPLKSICY